MSWPTTPKPRTTAHDEQPEAVDDAGTPVKPLRQRFDVWYDEQGRQVDESETDWESVHESDQDHDELEGQDDWKFSRQRAGVWYDGQGCPVNPSQTDWVSVYSREGELGRELDGQDNEAEAPGASSGLLGTPVSAGASSQPPGSTDEEGQEDPSPHSTRTTNKSYCPRHPFLFKGIGPPTCRRIRFRSKGSPITLFARVVPDYPSTRPIQDKQQHVFLQFDRVQDGVLQHKHKKLRLAIVPRGIRAYAKQGNLMVDKVFVPWEQYSNAGEGQVQICASRILFQSGKQRAEDKGFVGWELPGDVFTSFVGGVILQNPEIPRTAPLTFSLYWEISYAKGRFWRVTQRGRFKAKLGSGGWEGRNYFD